MSEFKKDLARRLSEDLQEFAKREDFDPGEFCSTITRFAISLNYDFSDCPVTALVSVGLNKESLFCHTLCSSHITFSAFVITLLSSKDKVSLFCMSPLCYFSLVGSLTTCLGRLR